MGRPRALARREHLLVTRIDEFPCFLQFFFQRRDGVLIFFAQFQSCLYLCGIGNNLGVQFSAFLEDAFLVV